MQILNIIVYYSMKKTSTRASGIHTKMGNLSIQWDVDIRQIRQVVKLANLLLNTDGINESLLKHNFDFLPCYISTKSKTHLSIPHRLETYISWDIRLYFFHNETFQFIKYINRYSNNDNKFVCQIILSK